VESLPNYWNYQPLWVTILEWFFGITFTIDYTTRLLTARVWYKWMIEPFNIIDLISTVPFWLDLALNNFVRKLAVLRVVRLLRVFRVVRTARYNAYIHVLPSTLMHSMDALFLLLFVLLVVIVFFSSIFFFSEQTGQRFNSTDHVWYRHDGSVSPFQSIFHCFWWCIETVTTVGYGDVFPVTVLGKIVAGVSMIGGIVMLAFPIAVLGSNFNHAWKELELQKEKQRRQENGGGESNKSMLLQTLPSSTVHVDLEREREARRIELKETFKRLKNLLHAEGIEI